MEPVRFCWCPEWGCRAQADVTNYRMVEGSPGPVVVVTVWCCAGHWFRGLLESDVVYMD